MPLEIVQFHLGPMDNNTYMIADPGIKLAAVIDPSFDSQIIVESAREHDWTISAIWLTHAHFDHIAGINTLHSAYDAPLPVTLHAEDLPLWRQHGGADLFGLKIETGPEPVNLITDGQILQLGSQVLEVRHTPGHTQGHVIYYSAEYGAAFCGDLIFFHGIGRTDLPGGSQRQLIRSIKAKIFTLPPKTRLLSGHGPETTVEEEMHGNPYLY